MEEKPPTQAARDADRSQASRAPFSTPEQSTPQSKPAGRSPRRGGKAAPPVTFQPPAGDAGADTSSSGTSARPKPPPRKGAGQRPGRPGAARPAAGTGSSTPAEQQTPAEQTPAAAGAPADGSGTGRNDDPAASSRPESHQPAKAVPAKAASTRRRAARSAPARTAEAADSGSTAVPQPPAEQATGSSEATTASADRPAPTGGPVKATAEAPQEADATTPTAPDAAQAAEPGTPVKAAPPRPEGIPGAPEPSDTSVQEQVIADQTTPASPAKLARTKATPAKKAARKGGRPAKAQQPATPAEAQQQPATPAEAQQQPGTPAEAQQQPGTPAEAPATEGTRPGTTETTATGPITAAATAIPADTTGTTPATTEESTAKTAVEATEITTAMAAADTTTGRAEDGDGDRTGAEPIPPAEDQPTTTEPRTEPQNEPDDAPGTDRTGADPIPPADKAADALPAKLTSTEPWAQLIADPGHAPELLALAAVQTIGPRAAEWAGRHREAYPNATGDALARLAVQQFTRFGSVASVFAAVAGSYAPITLLGSNALTYAEIVLHVAAAYGQDPTDRQRAVDLLVLAQVHPSREDAEAALTAAEQPAYEEETRLTDAVWRLGRMVAAQAGVWAVLKGVNRFFPGTAMLAAIMTSRSGARTMGDKATAYYRSRG